MIVVTGANAVKDYCYKVIQCSNKIEKALGIFYGENKEVKSFENNIYIICLLKCQPFGSIFGEHAVIALQDTCMPIRI